MTKSFTPLQPQTVLAVVAHPDDIECCFGGTLAAWAAKGANIYYLVLTDGCNGTTDAAAQPENVTATRKAEQQTAAGIIGASGVAYGSSRDGELVNSRTVVGEIVHAIRQIKPEVVLTFDPSLLFSSEHDMINHPDHRAAGQATLDAVFPFARNSGSFPELLAKGLQPHSVKTVLLHNYDTHNFYVNISETLETKLQAFAAHVSQAADVSAMTPRLRAEAELHGAHLGVKYAEAFIRIDIA